MTDEPPFRVLSLDGGGAKGFYTLGVLKEVEALVGEPLHKRFDLVYGTSTGAIIAALICLGKSADEILALYKEHVVKIMAKRSRAEKSAALAELAREVFGDATFEAVQTRIGVVAARWMEERPMIFKADINQAFGRQATFKPGFGAKIGDAVVASCAAYPFFNKQIVATSQGDVELVDGGYCANNPTLCAVSQVPHVLRVGARIRLCSRDRLFRTGRNADREFPQAAFRELHDKAPKHQ
jgi:patatin-like phospholipase/acyl hydrolase